MVVHARHACHTAARHGTRATVTLLATGGLLVAGAGVAQAAPLEARQQAKLVADDAAAGDQFGGAVAVDDDTAVVGSFADDNDKGSRAGAVYVYTRSGDSFSQVAKLVAPDGAADDNFGASVALDGNTLVVGAPLDDDGGSAAGSAYVFTRDGASFTQQAKLVAPDPAAGDNFGRTVGVDGEVVVVGSPNDDDAGSGSGSVYAYTRTGTTFSEPVKLVAPDAAAGDSFGRSLAISGERVAVGVPNDDDAGTNSGSVSVFALPATERVAKLTASDGAFGDFFGDAVDIDGDTVVVGAFSDHRVGSDTGAAYVFVESGTGYTQQATLVAPDGAAFDNFGISVAVEGDVFVIGIRAEDDGGSNAGAADVFRREGGEIARQTRLLADDRAAGDLFGTEVALSGSTAVVGSQFDDDAGASSGSAYAFVLFEQDEPAPAPVIPEAPVAALLPLAALGAAALTITTQRRRAARG